MSRGRIFPTAAPGHWISSGFKEDAQVLNHLSALVQFKRLSNQTYLEQIIRIYEAMALWIICAALTDRNNRFILD